MINRCRMFRIILVNFFMFSTCALAEVDARKIIQDAEAKRVIDNVLVNVDLRTIITSKQGKQEIRYGLIVERGVQRRAIVKFSKPEIERGRRMLVVGHQYWAKFPDSKRVHLISRKEVIGNSVFQLVDLFQMDIEKDYDFKREKSGIGCHGKRKCHKIVLKAKHDDAPYAKVDYYIDEVNHMPRSADFYGISGKKLKTLKVISTAVLVGQERPETFEMVDQVTKGRKSVWNTQKMTPRKFPSSYFVKESLLGFSK
jgi:hypothetical protein